MLTRLACAAAFLAFTCVVVSGQEGTAGISVPITISGDARYAGGDRTESDESRLTGGFRATISPSLRLGRHWFFYSSVQAYSSHYFSYDAGPYETHQVNADVLQAFVGYTATISRVTLLLKAGQLSSAFGTFPLEYDDARMPLVDAPPPYVVNLPLRPDQRPCGVQDLLSQGGYGGMIDFDCGGSETDRYGLVPVTLFGLPAIEADLSFARLDARFQLTNSSPVNPQGLTSSSQFVQFTAGAGYTFRSGLRIGTSGFRGPYLDEPLTPFLPPGTVPRSFPASGIGLDAQWSRGPWSVQGEWQRFQFDLPAFITSPSEDASYVQAKCILSPRLFLAVRASHLNFGAVQDTSGSSANHFSGPEDIYELGSGYRLNRAQLVKLGIAWTHGPAWSVDGGNSPTTNSYRFEAQLVTSFTAVSKVFR